MQALCDGEPNRGCDNGQPPRKAAANHKPHAHICGDENQDVKNIHAHIVHDLARVRRVPIGSYVALLLDPWVLIGLVRKRTPPAS
jgi:hypothetical protein